MWGLGRGQWDQQDLWDLEEQTAPGEGIPSWGKDVEYLSRNKKPTQRFWFEVSENICFCSS